MVKTFWPILLFVMLFSCDSLFDSYFSNTVEFLEKQVDVKNLVESGDFATVNLRFVSTRYIGDILVAVVFTTDGKAQILFFDPTNLSLKRKISDSELRAANNGSMPNLSLIGESSFYSVAVGDLGFDATLSPVKVLSSSIGNITSNFGDLKQTRLAADFSIPNDYVVGGTSVTAIGYKYLSGSYNALGASTVNGSIASLTTTTIIDFRIFNGIYYLALDDSNGICFAKGNTIGTITSQYLISSSFGNREGYVTTRGVVVQDRSGNFAKLHVYDQSGGQRDDFALKINNEVTAFEFQPDGNYWYMFSSSSGKISRMKTWW